MISREEFNHQLQTGRVQSALASVLQSLTELEITTQLASERADRPYFRTKIDLLGGSIVDEISANFADGDRRDCWLQLQRAHVERVAASYDLACDYLERIESLLAAMPADPTGSDAAVPTRLGEAHAKERLAPIGKPDANSERQLGASRFANAAVPVNPTSEQGQTDSKSPPPALVAKLQQARASLTSRLGSDIAPAMLFPSRSDAASSTLVAEIEPIDDGDESDEMAIILENAPGANCGLSADDLAAVTTIVDEEIDLAMALSAGYATEENGELWAGWVEDIEDEDEDDDNRSTLSPQPPANPTLLDWREIPTIKYVDPIEVKPIIPRPIARSLDLSDRWDNFEPDYLGIDLEPQPPSKNHLSIDN